MVIASAGHVDEVVDNCTASFRAKPFHDKTHQHLLTAFEKSFAAYSSPRTLPTAHSSLDKQAPVESYILGARPALSSLALAAGVTATTVRPTSNNHNDDQLL